MKRGGIRMSIIFNPNDISMAPISTFGILRACAACCARTEDSGWSSTPSSEYS